jgi:hypothetical protein
MFMGMDNAEGICMKMERSDPPYSSNSTLHRPSALKRSASTQPADPAPTMT